MTFTNIFIFPVLWDQEEEKDDYVYLGVIQP